MGAVALALFVAFDTHAASERRIRALNIGVQSLMTLASGIVQGKVRSLADAGNCLGSGAAGGYGAFASKILVRNGHVARGWLLANFSASLSENAAAGKNPLAQVGYTVGPLRLRVVALERNADAYAYVDASLYQAAKLIEAASKADRTRFRSGLIVFERHTPYAQLDGAVVTGSTWGIYPGVWSGAFDVDTVRRHEVVHAIQSLQGDAVDPSFSRLTLHARPGGRRRIVRFEHLKVGAVNLLNDAIANREAYQNSWEEIEAYRLVQRTAPPTLP